MPPSKSSSSRACTNRCSGSLQELATSSQHMVKMPPDGGSSVHAQPEVNLQPATDKAVTSPVDTKSAKEKQETFQRLRQSSNFEESIRVLTKAPRSFLNRFWLTIVSTAALLDFCSTLAYDYLDSKRDVIAETLKGLASNQLASKQLSRHRPQTMMEETLDWKERWANFVHWMAEYKVEFAILFSLIWFTDAFVKAQSRRDKKLRELDKERLQTKINGDVKEEGNFGAWGTYYWAVFVQLVLLPVSFYLLLGYCLRIPMNEELVSKALGDDKDLDIVFHNKDGSVDELHSFTTSTTQTLFFAWLRYTVTVVARVTGVRVKAKIRGFAAFLARRLAFFTIRNPRRAAQRFKKIRTVLRWLKYLAPLIATGNKLRGNVIDLIKKYRQRKAAKKAQRVRVELWKKQKNNLDPVALEAKAATIIQSRFRARQAKRAVKALQLIIGKKEELACLRMQKILRAKLAKARHNLLLKKIELQKLQKKQMDMKKAKSNLTIEERRRMYELQDELGAEARELINKKLLLRPNTSFAVFWKILFVFCVLFEISQLALAPALRKYVNRRTGEQMDIEQVLSYNLVPTPVSRRKECGYVNAAEEEIVIEKQPPKVLQWLKKAQPRKPGFMKSKEPETFPWYCKEPLATTHWFYVQLLKLLLHEFMVVVGIVCFLDVFITFFTGELHPENGSLIPKPFFTRWILPGILLQMLVNPQMETVGRWVFLLMKEIMRLGPILVYRWSAALFYPVFLLLLYFIEHHVWRPVVKKENSSVYTKRPKTTENLKSPAPHGQDKVKTE